MCYAWTKLDKTRVLGSPVSTQLYMPGKASSYTAQGSRNSYSEQGRLYYEVAGEYYQYQIPVYDAGTPSSYTKQGDPVGATLYYAGREYKDGLYADVAPAAITTKNIEALVVGSESE